MRILFPLTTKIIYRKKLATMVKHIILNITVASRVTITKKKKKPNY